MGLNLLFFIFGGKYKFYFDAGLPDTSILETSTEDLDTSQSEEPPKKEAKTSEEKMEVTRQILNHNWLSSFLQ